MVFGVEFKAEVGFRSMLIGSVGMLVFGFGDFRFRRLGEGGWRGLSSSFTPLTFSPSLARA